MSLLLKSPHISDKGLRETKLELTLKCLPWGTALTVLEVLGKLPRNKNQSIVLPAVTPMRYNDHHRRSQRYNSGTYILRVTKRCLIELEACSIGGNSCLAVVHDYDYGSRPWNQEQIYCCHFHTPVFNWIVCFLGAQVILQRLAIFQIYSYIAGKFFPIL